VRHSSARTARVPEALCATVALRPPLHRDGRVLAHAGAGPPSLRQHDERRGDGSSADEPRAALLPRDHAGLRPSDWRNPGIHLRRIGPRVHRFGNPRARSGGRQNRTSSGGMMAELSGLDWVGIFSIIMASVAVSVGSIAPALAEGRAIAQALAAIAQQPDEANTISRTLFIGLAIIESSGIYCFVIAIVLIFANPFWGALLARAGG